MASYEAPGYTITHQSSIPMTISQTPVIPDVVDETKLRCLSCIYREPSDNDLCYYRRIIVNPENAACDDHSTTPDNHKQ